MLNKLGIPKQDFFPPRCQRVALQITYSLEREACPFPVGALGATAFAKRSRFVALTGEQT